jgi:hypothetical protein
LQRDQPMPLLLKLLTLSHQPKRRLLLSSHQLQQQNQLADSRQITQKWVVLMMFTKMTLSMWNLRPSSNQFSQNQSPKPQLLNNSTTLLYQVKNSLMAVALKRSQSKTSTSENFNEKWLQLMISII